MKDSPLPPPASQGPTRRAVLRTGALSAAAASLTTGRALADPFPQIKGPYLFLLDRATFGLESEMLTEINRRGWEGWLDWQLDPASIDDSAADAIIQSTLPSLSMTPWEIVQAYSANPGLPPIEAELAPIFRGYYSRRQLFYRICDFWSNVFSTFVLMGGQEWFYSPYHQARICANAMGNFRDLLQVSAEGASMLFYLNQDASSKTNPIENYARELLELHTLGLSDNPATPTYTEADVVAVAEILTGWGFKKTADSSLGDFEFRDSDHKKGKKYFLGVEYPSVSGPGKAEGDDLLDQICGNPNTAKHIAKRAIEYFVADDPPKWYLNQVADAFYQSGLDIPTLMRAVFDRSIYTRLGKKKRAKMRRPLFLVTGFLRATKPAIVSGEFIGMLTAMGNLPGTHPAPDGFPTENEAWIPGIQPRLAFADAAVNQLAGFDLSDAMLDTLFDQSGFSIAQQADWIIAGGALPFSEVVRIEQHLASLPAGVDPRREALSLALSSPTYQFLLA